MLMITNSLRKQRIHFILKPNSKRLPQGQSAALGSRVLFSVPPCSTRCIRQLILTAVCGISVCKFCCTFRASCRCGLRMNCLSAPQISAEMVLEPSLFILRLNVQLGGCPPMLSQNPLDISHHIISISTSQVWHPIAVLFLLPFCPIIYLPLKKKKK